MKQGNVRGAGVMRRGRPSANERVLWECEGGKEPDHGQSNISAADRDRTGGKPDRFTSTGGGGERRGRVTREERRQVGRRDTEAFGG